MLIGSKGRSLRVWVGITDRILNPRIGRKDRIRRYIEGNNHKILSLKSSDETGTILPDDPGDGGLGLLPQGGHPAPLLPSGNKARLCSCS